MAKYEKKDMKSDQDMDYCGIRPAMKTGPAPADMGTTSGREQAKRFYKGDEK